MIRIPLKTGPLLAGLFLCVSVDAAEIDSSELATLPDADVVILGEVHDNPAHHVNQAMAVAGLRPAALVFEMFGPDAALAATAAVRTAPGPLQDALRWNELGWPEFGMYYPIFAAAPEAALFGGAIPRDEVRRAVRDGAASVLGGSAPLFGLDGPLDEPEQGDREAGQMAAHCDALPEDILPGMVEAQRLRDAGLARAILAALAETGGPVAVITGNGHARRDWGIPRMLSRAAPDISVVTVAQFEAPPEPDPPFDLWVVTEPAPREDPCAVFRD